MLFVSFVTWNLIDRIDKRLDQPDLFERQTLPHDRKTDPYYTCEYFHVLLFPDESGSS